MLLVWGAIWLVPVAAILLALGSTMMSGPGVVSAMPRPSSISPGLSQP
jgi:hypothetical protein